MAMVINTNVASLNAQRNLSRSQESMTQSLQRLSTGLRINSAKDDAAGLAITEKLTTQIRGMNVAIRNSNDGISLAQTAESSLVEVSNNLQRIRELAVQSKNATNSASDRTALDNEVQELISEIGRIGSSANFNGVKLLDGSAGTAGVLTFQVGAAATDTVDVDLSGADISALTGITATAGSVTTAGAANTLIGNVDTALDAVNTARAQLGAVQNRFSSVVASLGNSVEAASASRSRVQDADFAAETASMTKSQILQQAGVAMLSQANSMPQAVLSLLK